MSTEEARKWADDYWDDDDVPADMLELMRACGATGYLAAQQSARERVEAYFKEREYTDLSPTDILDLISKEGA